ncbi:SIP domain-containing protein [Sphaerisporangium sp. B11E5]|uniref:SIP domain-containing protein n=1 Tax=Sphaerisporangium sp. B11E5 TaxID=3153563 RepID=UPI00325CBD0A
MTGGGIIDQRTKILLPRPGQGEPSPAHRYASSRAPYAWVAGERDLVRGTRRHLVDDGGGNAAAHHFGGSWKSGQTG